MMVEYNCISVQTQLQIATNDTCNKTGKLALLRDGDLFGSSLRRLREGHGQQTVLHAGCDLILLLQLEVSVSYVFTK
jgi:hypothetical protein